MAQQIRRFGVAQTAKVFAVLYGIMGAVFIPFFLLASLFGGDAAGFGVGFALVFPVLYALMGFVFMAIACWLYNIVAGWVGGIEIEMEAAPGA